MMRRAVRDALGPDVQFRIFRWPGDNTHSSRVAAGERLAARMTALSSALPGAPQYVIAHSHGGNVVMYALRDDAAARAVPGVVTISTPFISCTPRRLPEILGRTVWILPITAFCLTALTGRQIEPLAPSGLRGLPITLGLIVGMVLMLVLVIGFAPGDARSRRFISWLWATERTALARWSTDARDTSRVGGEHAAHARDITALHCVRVGNDEAHAGIGVFSTVADLPFQLLPIVRRAVVAAGALFSAAIAVSSAGVHFPVLVVAQGRGCVYVLAYWWPAIGAALAASVLFRGLVFGKEGVNSALLLYASRASRFRTGRLW